MTEQTDPPSLLRALLGVTAVIVILTAMRLSTDFLSPVLLAIIFALLFAPYYGWLRRKMPVALALLVVVISQILLVGGLFLLMARSAESLRAGLDEYSTQLDAQIDQLATSLEARGISASRDIFNSEAMVSLLSFVLDSILDVVGATITIILLGLFLISEGSSLVKRAREALPPNNPQLQRLLTFGNAVIRQFGLRAIVNAITGAGFTIVLLLLGVDYAVLWGVLTFFLSYIPYIGIVIAGTPAVILAFAEFGLEQALLVVLALAIINLSAENLLAPQLMARGLNVSTTVTFFGFMFWLWLLGGPGAFLAMPLTILAIMLLDSYPETQWLARIAMRPTTVPEPNAPAIKGTK